MTHLTEEQLVLFAMDEHSEAGTASRHLSECAACRAELAVIRKTLRLTESVEPPEPDAFYGAYMWRRLGPQLPRRRPSIWTEWFQWPRLAAMGAVAALVVVAFLAGRRFPEEKQAPELAKQRMEDGQFRQRMLFVTLRDHLEESQRVLTGLSNADERDLELEREPAENLLAANRLYRYSVAQSGDRNMALLLEELEKFLTEAAHAGPEELQDLQRRMAEGDILFQLRIVNSRLREKQRTVLRRQFD